MSLHDILLPVSGFKSLVFAKKRQEKRWGLFSSHFQDVQGRQTLGPSEIPHKRRTFVSV